MYFKLWTFTVFAILVVCSCDEEANTKTAQDRSDVVKVVFKEGVNKRQTPEKSFGGTQHIQYGASPGHYVLKAAKEDDSQINIEYFNLLKRLQEGAQSSAAEPRPAIQQYVVQRNPRPQRVRPIQREQKVVKIDPSLENEQQQFYIDEKYLVQQPRLLARPQAVKPAHQPAYQGYVSIPNRHEARVQSALSVGEGKPAEYSAQQSFYKNPQAAQHAFPDSSFEKELAELVAANQAIELKEKPQQYQFYQQPQHNFIQQPQQNYAQQPQQNYAQQPQQSYAQQPQQNYAQQPQQQKKLSPVRLNQDTVSFSQVPYGRSKNPAPQQYLIETTKPQEVQSKPVPQKIKPQQQYLQAYPEDEPRYVEYQPNEQKSALKIVSAPRLQPTLPPQYEYLGSKQQSNNIPPAYLKYYQTIKPQTEEVEAPKEVKIGSFYPKYSAPKTKAAPAPKPAEEQPQYIIQYQQPTKAEEPPTNYVRYDTVKPQLLEYSPENEAYLQALIAQSQANSNRATSPRTKPVEQEKTVKIQPKPQPAPAKAEAHSSIFVSKHIAPKKQEPSVKIVSSPQPEAPEELPTVRLPPPKNNKVYTQEEFQALLEAGYSVTPVPVTDDEGTPAKFSPPPPNYPGHSGYQQQYAQETQERQYFENENSEAYQQKVAQIQAARKRKSRRPTASPQYVINQEAASESQSQIKYSYPLETQETVSYGLRNQPRNRNA